MSRGKDRNRDRSVDRFAEQGNRAERKGPPTRKFGPQERSNPIVALLAWCEYSRMIEVYCFVPPDLPDQLDPQASAFPSPVQSVSYALSVRHSSFNHVFIEMAAELTLQGGNGDLRMAVTEIFRDRSFFHLIFEGAC